MINQAIKADENRWSKSWEYAVYSFSMCLISNDVHFS